MNVQSNISNINISKDKRESSYINYSPFGAGDSGARHGYNGEIGKNSKYLLGEGNRLYISSLGVFNQKDNLNVSNGGGVNTYIYGNQNPINQYDPSGNSSTGFYAGNIIGIAAGIAGIVFAIPTGGASLSVSGGVSIALASAEVAATTASVALYSTDHQEGASITGWVAMGLGLASLGSSSISAFSKNLNKATSKIQKVNGKYGIPLDGLGRKNALGLYEAEDFSKAYNHNFYNHDYVYRIDKQEPLSILLKGFQPSNKFNSIPKMMEEDALIVSETPDGLREYIAKYHRGATCLYKIDVRGVRGVSLNYNLENNTSAAMLKYLGAPEPENGTLFDVLILINNTPTQTDAHIALETINNEIIARVQFFDSITKSYRSLLDTLC